MDVFTRWSPDAVFVAADLVAYNGDLYEALDTSTGVAPPGDGTKWRRWRRSTAAGTPGAILPVFGTPSASKIPKWNASTQRLEWADDNGGSGASGPTDLGVVNAVDLIAGPVTLFTPSAGQIVWGLLLRAGTFIPESSLAVRIGTASGIKFPTGGSVDSSGCMGYFDNDLMKDAVNLAADGDILIGGGGSNYRGHGIEVTTQAVVADLIIPGVGVASGAVAWQANHVYAGTEIIKQADPINSGFWYWTPSAGTSGGSLPVFDNTAFTVTDNDITWSVQQAIPSGGSVHAYINLGTA